MPGLKNRTIGNPLKKICVDNDQPLSLIEIFITREDLYNELCRRKNIYDLKVAFEIIDFFKSTPKPSLKKSQNNKIKYYTEKWRIYKNSRRKKIVQLKAMEGLLQELIVATMDGGCVWKQISSGIRKRMFITVFKGNKFYMEVMSFRNDEKKRERLELQVEDINGKIKVCPKDYNEKIYDLIKEKSNGKKKESVSSIKKHESDGKGQEVQIKHGDFVVRTNLFRCFYKEHSVEEIIGVLKIVTPMGKEIIEKIPCAHCPECNCFYMLTSEYNKVSQKGILLCQLIDKDEYYKSGIANKFSGANESLLMRNGYNVNAKVGLTDIQRQVILKNIIENKILTPHRIVSYIEIFIAQKKKLPQYREAVLKWQRDKSYVLAYNEEEKKCVTVESIKR